MMNRLLLLLASTAPFARSLRPHLATANAESTTGTHGTDTKRADAAHLRRHLLVRAGSNSEHVALGNASSLPLGVTSDQPGAAEDPINVHLLGVARGTVRMTCATALAGQTDVYAAANGFVSALPGSAGSYYRVGRTRGTAAYSDTNVYIAEVEPCLPEKVTVIAAATGTAATDVAALFTALQGGPVRLKAL